MDSFVFKIHLHALFVPLSGTKYRRWDWNTLDNSTISYLYCILIIYIYIYIYLIFGTVRCILDGLSDGDILCRVNWVRKPLYGQGHCGSSQTALWWQRRPHVLGTSAGVSTHRLGRVVSHTNTQDMSTCQAWLRLLISGCPIGQTTWRPVWTH